MRAIFFHPLLHFLALGGLLYTLVALRTPVPEPIKLDASELAALRANWQRETGRIPDAASWDASLRRHADEERLLREALRLGFDQRDPVVRERLLQNLAFAFPQRELNPARALQLARQLGMAERDLVARRRLVQLAEASLVHAAHHKPMLSPTDKAVGIELRAIRQLWFDGVQGQARARAALAALRRGEDVAGDPFLLGERVAAQNEVQFERRFGADFARAVMQAEADTWIGPITSPYGVHLLRVESVQVVPAPSPHPYRVMAERESEALRAGLAELRMRYPLQLAGVAP